LRHCGGSYMDHLYTRIYKNSVDGQMFDAKDKIKDKA
jgi:hypothetical protein